MMQATGTERGWTTALPDGIMTLVREVERMTSLTPPRAADALRSLRVSVDDLTQWTDVDHPVADSYGRKLITRGPNFELMLMSWAPGDYSAIHDHGVAEWGAVRYFGVADHVVFDLHEGRLSIRETMRTAPGDVYEVDHDLIHLMGNPGLRPFLSMHLYGREQACPSVTGGARIFDLYEGNIQRTDGGVFFCLPEADIDAREPGPEADRATTELHHRLMLARLQRMMAHGAAGPELRRRAARLERLVARDRAESLRAAG